MTYRDRFITFCTDHPIGVMAATFLFCLALAAQIPSIQIDTDPENMLSEDEFVRVFHNQVKKEFSLHDMIVLGVVNEENPDGVFNPETLSKVYRLTQEIAKMEGVIEVDLLAPSKVDDIQQAGLGSVSFEWLMPRPPQTRKEALHIRDRARENPMLDGTLLSEDGKALCLYIPIREKTMSYRIAAEIRERIRGLEGPEQYHITGLPVAEDTFGIEMFTQMAVSAPLAGLIIFVLMWFFFKSFLLVVSAMIIAIVTVLSTMGLLIGLGFTVHIMSSMIPIFLMPIAVVDSIHILSEFFDRYPAYKDRRQTILHVMGNLFNPMLFTSLTSAAGFASLALTPNPPVKVFGLFVTFGILLAWFVTITFIPAYVMLLKEKHLRALGEIAHHDETPSTLGKWLKPVAGWTYKHYKSIITASVLVLAVSGIGISTIVINDNPVKWFEKDHPIRVADKVLNAHFGGTYMAYLVLEAKQDGDVFRKQVASLKAKLKQRIESLQGELPGLKAAGQEALRLMDEAINRRMESGEVSTVALLEQLERTATDRMRSSKDDLAVAWDEISYFFNEQKVGAQTFKSPETLHVVKDLEARMMQSGAVGKVNTVVDIIEKVHYELMEGNKEYATIPDTAAGVAQTLISYQNSHDPDDLWHMVTPDYNKANLWVQLKSGDNKDMEPVLRAVREFFEEKELPMPLDHQWAGLTYLNVVWQDKMVNGMLKSLLGSFVIVFLMAMFLFRSPLWGLLCMVPLSVTITFTYGMIGFLGKDYDMPVAVLSAMTLGLSVDFAIHFLQRSRVLHARLGDWHATSREMFGEPARAISRNILVIAIGFTPLLFAPLVPYQTVGFLLASIMIVSGIATLVILPALMRWLEGPLFHKGGLGISLCHPVSCVTLTVISVTLITYGLHGLGFRGWPPVVWGVLAGLVGTALLCHYLSKRAMKA